MRKNLLVMTAALLALNLACGSASAAGVHDGDILPRLEGGQIVLDHLDDRELDFTTGYAIFEGDFADFAGGPDATKDPGFDHESGEFTPGTLLAFRVRSPLEFWNGSSWSSAHAATLSIIDVLDSSIDVSAAPASVGLTGLIGQFDGAGNLHQHIDFKINSTAPIGAYAVALSLFGLLADQTTPVYGESTPFMIIFNRGLGEAAFEAAVGARVVPVPAAAWLFASALAGLGVMRRKHAMQAA